MFDLWISQLEQNPLEYLLSNPKDRSTIHSVLIHCFPGAWASQPPRVFKREQHFTQTTFRIFFELKAVWNNMKQHLLENFDIQRETTWKNNYIDVSEKKMLFRNNINNICWQFFTLSQKQHGTSFDIEIFMIKMLFQYNMKQHFITVFIRQKCCFKTTWNNIWWCYVYSRNGVSKHCETTFSVGIFEMKMLFRNNIKHLLQILTLSQKQHWTTFLSKFSWLKCCFNTTWNNIWWCYVFSRNGVLKQRETT